MNSTSNTRIHVLGLGLSYDEAYDLAIEKGIPKRYLDRHDVDDALNDYFSSRGYATVITELPPHEASKYAEDEFDYCIITNFRVVQRDPNSPYNIREDRPRRDEWTERVAGALLPGAEYKGMLMRITYDSWGTVPGLIHTFYKHQARGKPIIQAHGLSPDQTDYRPLLKERAARLRHERAAGFILAFHGKDGLKLAMEKAQATTSVTPITTSFSSDTPTPKALDDKTPTAKYFTRHSGVDYFTCKPVPPPYEEEEEDMKTPTATSSVPSAPLVGCNSDSDEGYFSDKPLVYTR
ncbi:unnamed protein product [Peniophora sp. CBMAI 1063]|nr:unnamed protein product [Peniophora sp. CBMAI 1063]